MVRFPPSALLPLVCSLPAFGPLLACRAPEQSPRASEARSLEELVEMLSDGAQPVEAAEDAELSNPLDPLPQRELDPEVLAPLLSEGGRVKELGEGPAEAAAPPRRKNPYLAFGGRIIVHEDGRVTKPYAVPPKRGRRLLDLLLLMSRQGFVPVEEVQFDKPGEPNPEVVRAVLLENWDAELYQNLRNSPPKEQDVATSDWLVCTATQPMLDEVEYFMELFASSVPQIEIEAKIVELTETNTFDYGIGPQSDSSGNAVPQIQLPGTGLVDEVLFDFPNTESANEAILALGAVQDGVTVTAILEAVKTWDNVSVISQPKIAVREGGRAEIVNIEELPFFNVKSISDQGTFNATLDFKEVGVKLFIVPRVVGSKTFALHIDIEASQQAGSLTTVVANQGGDLATPIIAKRSVKTIVYLEKGQVLILGGLTTERKREFERKIPLLGDIPLLGYLFKSKFNEVTRSHVLFFIRPRVLEGSDFNRDF